MGMKRSRTKKLEDNQKYRIVVEEPELREYIHTNIQSGLEVDEEKEYHFKNVMKEKSGVIHVPEIQEIEEKNQILHKDFSFTKNFIKNKKDVENKIEILEEDKIFCIENKINEDVLLELLQNITRQELFDKTKYRNIENLDKILEYCQQREIKTFFHDDYDSFLCFRNRVIRSTRKSRKSDQSASEKIKKLNKEVELLKMMEELTIERFRLEEELENTQNEIFDLTIKNSKLRSKKIINEIFNVEKKQELNFYKTCNNLEELRKDKKKLVILKKLYFKKKIESNVPKMKKETFYLFHIK